MPNLKSKKNSNVTESIYFTMPNDFDSISDFYIPAISPRSGVYYPGAVHIHTNDFIDDIVDYLHTQCLKKTTDDFSIRFKIANEKETIIFRGRRIKSIDCDWFALRRLPKKVPELSKLNFNKNIHDFFKSEKIENGLFIVCGETGNGKTTTLASIINYRLRNMASFCMTIEDPIEMPLEGYYDNFDKNNNYIGRGVCIQTEVSSADEKEYGLAVKGALRSYPTSSNSILFLGEIRDGLTAMEALKIAASGHLVMTTLHANDIQSGIKRYMDMCKSTGKSIEEIKSLLSSVIRVIVHQELVNIHGKKEKKPSIKLAYSPDSKSQLAGAINQEKMDSGLPSVLQLQHSIVSSGKDIIDEITKP